MTDRPLHARATRWLALVLLAAGAHAGQEPENVTPGPGTVSLPRGAAALALDAVEPGTAARTGLRPWPAWSDRSPAGWGGEATWRRWVELVRDERAAERPDPARRAELARVARLQGRDGDAWMHFASIEDPAWLVTLLPLFLPGVPEDELERAGPLPDGVLLSPSLPPSDVPGAGLRHLAGTRIEALDFALGAARARLSLRVDRDGLEVKVVHLAGGPANVRVRPPLPRGVEAGLLFADWEKQSGPDVTVAFRLTAEEPEHILWLSFHPPRDHLANPPLALLRSPAAGRTLLVVSPGGDEPVLSGLTGALEELLGVPARLVAPEYRPAAGLEPLVLRLDESPAGERRLAHWLGLAERHLLAPRDR